MHDAPIVQEGGAAVPVSYTHLILLINFYQFMLKTECKVLYDDTVREKTIPLKNEPKSEETENGRYGQKVYTGRYPGCLLYTSRCV